MSESSLNIIAQPILEDLSHDESHDRLALEMRVERAFYQAGCALRELRDRRLYRSTHNSFEQYCQDRFGYTRRRGDLLINSAMIVDNLKQDPKPDKNRDQFVHIFHLDYCRF